MKTLSKLQIGLLALLLLNIVSCKKDLAPLPSKMLSNDSLSNDYSRVTTVARGFGTLSGIVVDTSGNIYVAEENTSRILKVKPDGTVTTLAGGGGVGSADGTGSAAKFNDPKGMAMGPDKNIYVGDSNNNTIRKVTLTGVVTTVAGIPGVTGHTDGPVAKATFYSPFGVRVDCAGNIYVSDAANSSIRVVTICATVYTLAGNGTEGLHNGPGATATFVTPVDVALDRQGNAYTSDQNQVIRKITPDGIVSTFEGSGVTGFQDGTEGGVEFFGPAGLVFDSRGNLYVADRFNNRIRKIWPDLHVVTLAGNGATGAVDGINGISTFNSPYFLAIDKFDNLYVTDGDTHGLIRKIVTK
jgi:sugar lactone lactonase YvrE